MNIVPQPVKLCKNCVHYVPPPKKIFKKPDPKEGKCSLFANMNYVDGELEIELAVNARKDLCKGEFFK